LFEYSSEVIDTGIEALDDIEEENSLDTYLYQIFLEDGSLLLNEDRSSVILEEFATTRSNANTDNTDLLNFSDILDFSETNPFGEVG
jgi:hypothetical protein